MIVLTMMKLAVNAVRKDVVRMRNK